jgi:hypothetical protein
MFLQCVRATERTCNKKRNEEKERKKTNGWIVSKDGPFGPLCCYARAPTSTDRDGGTLCPVMIMSLLEEEHDDGRGLAWSHATPRRNETGWNSQIGEPAFTPAPSPATPAAVTRRAPCHGETFLAGLLLCRMVSHPIRSSSSLARGFRLLLIAAWQKKARTMLGASRLDERTTT